jgi:nicotinamidase-related amidase
MKIRNNEVAALVVDMQEKLLPHIFESEKLLKTSLKLIEGLRVLSVPVLVTQQYTKGLGATNHEIANLFSDFNFIEKSAFSCYGEPKFKETLDDMGKKQIIICGIESHICVLQTCIDLLNAGYLPIIIEDCVSSRNYNDKAVAIARMRQAGAVITTMESVLFELTQCAGTDTFKAISKIVK